MALRIALVRRIGAPSTARLGPCLRAPCTAPATLALLDAWSAEGDALTSYLGRALQAVALALAQDEPPRYVAVSDVHDGDKVLFLKSPQSPDWIAFDAQGRADLHADVASVEMALRGRGNVEWIIGNVVMVEQDEHGIHRAIFASNK